MNADTQAVERNGFPALLQYRSFMLIWLGNTVSRFGDAIDSIAFMWMIYKLTGSFIMMGTIMAVNALPSLIFGLMAGVLVDRMSKRKAMIVTDLLRFAATAFIAFLFMTDNLQVYYLYVFTFFNSACEVFAHPARASAMQLLVRKEHYLPANSLREASSSAAQIIGMGLAAAILGLWGIGTAILVDALTFLFSAITAIVARIEENLKAVKEPISPVVIFRELKEGMSLIRESTVLTVAVVLACLANLLLTPYNILIPAYSDKILLAGAKGYSFIEMAFTTGIIIGAVLLGQIGSRFRKSILILSGFAVLGLGIGALGFIGNLYIAVLVCGFTGIFLPFINTSAITIVQEITPNEKMGRISSILGTLCMLGMPLGYAISGFIASGLEIQTTFMIMGLLIFIMVIPVLFIKEFTKY